MDIDLTKFFDTVNHDVLMNLLGRTVVNKRLLCLIGGYPARQSAGWRAH